MNAPPPQSSMRNRAPSTCAFPAFPCNCRTLSTKTEKPTPVPVCPKSLRPTSWDPSTTRKCFSAACRRQSVRGTAKSLLLRFQAERRAFPSGKRRKAFSAPARPITCHGFAVRGDRILATGTRCSRCDQRAGTPWLNESNGVHRHQRNHRVGTVDLINVHVGWTETSPLISRLGNRCVELVHAIQVAHLALRNAAVAVAGSFTEHIDWLAADLPGVLGRGHDIGAAAVRQHVAHQSGKRICDHAALEYFFDSKRLVAEHRVRLQVRPFPAGN